MLPKTEYKLNFTSLKNQFKFLLLETTTLITSLALWF